MMACKGAEMEDIQDIKVMVLKTERKQKSQFGLKRRKSGV